MNNNSVYMNISVYIGIAMSFSDCKKGSFPQWNSTIPEAANSQQDLLINIMMFNIFWAPFHKNALRIINKDHCLHGILDRFPRCREQAVFPRDYNGFRTFPRVRLADLTL